MNLQSITAPGFRGWKAWGPAFSTTFFAGVGLWYAKMIWGSFPVLDGIVIVLVFGILFQIWWIACVLKKVEIEGNNLRISGLGTSLTVARSDVSDVKDRSKIKRMPSVIVLK